MKCINHPEVDAIGTCVKCGKNLCIDCVRWLHGKTYCQPCAYNIPTQKADCTPISVNKRKTNIDLDEASNLSIAAKYCSIFGFICTIVLPLGLLVLLMGPDGQRILLTIFCIGITLDVLAITLGIFSLLNNPTPSSAKNALRGLVFSVIPLIIIGLLSLWGYQGQPTNANKYIGIALCISGIIFGMLSLFYHLPKRNIRMLSVGLLLGIVLVIFGIVYLAKF